MNDIRLRHVLTQSALNNTNKQDTLRAIRFDALRAELRAMVDAEETQYTGTPCRLFDTVQINTMRKQIGTLVSLIGTNVEVLLDSGYTYHCSIYDIEGATR